MSENALFIFVMQVSSSACPKCLLIFFLRNPRGPQKRNRSFVKLEIKENVICDLLLLSFGPGLTHMPNIPSVNRV